MIAIEKQILFDAIIVGGSYAGLSSAMTLGRSLRNVLVIDSGLPCNRQTPHSHNFLTRDGMPPGEISQIAKQQVEKYPSVRFYNGLATKGKKVAENFEITTADGITFKARMLVFATGIRDLMPPDIKGFSECWGISVIHCPYCHGYEVKGVKTGILLNGDRVMHFVPLIKNLTGDVTLLTSGKPALSNEHLVKLKKNGVQIIEEKVVEIEHTNGYVKSLIFQDGSKEDFNAVYAPLPFEQHCNIPQDLGCEMTETGLIKIDAFQKTSVAGVYAVGDNAHPMRSVALAVAAGNFAGAMVNMELSHNSF